MKEYSWYTLQFTPEEYVLRIKELEDVIKNIFDDYQFQDEVAIFRPSDFNILHQIWYIPPKTTKLTESKLKEYGAVPCEEPKIDSVIMELGNLNELKGFFTK